MSNSDYFFANIPGAQFRPEINAMMKAMLSKNSGVAEPPYLHPGMWWHDTRNNLLKRRNTANNGWVTVGNPESPNLGHALVGAINTFAEQQAFAKGIKFSSSGIEGTKTSVAANRTNSNIWGGGDTIDLTGPAPLQISDVANAPQPGLWRWVIMHAAHIIKDNANLEVIGDTDHRCTDGEMVLFYSKSTVAFKVFPFRQDGKPVSTYSLQPTRTTTGTTSVELSNIVPSWATKLYVNIMEMSLNGPHNPTIQLKDVAYKTSGYQGGATNVTTLAQRVIVFPTGVGLFSNSGLNLWRGVITFNLMDNATNTWGYTGNLYNSINRVYVSPSGIVSLSSRVTGVRLISSGSNTFDQMKASVAWT